MAKLIIGFIGQIGSGKGHATEYLKQHHGASTYKFSTILRDILTRLSIEQTRDTIVTLSEALRNGFGHETFAKALAHDIAAEQNELIVVDGVRRIADLAYLKDMPGFVLVEIAADPEVRFARLKNRDENADDATKTFEQFLKDHEQPTEKTILDVIALATERLENNGTPEDLHKQLDALIKKYEADHHTH